MRNFFLLLFCFGLVQNVQAQQSTKISGRIKSAAKAAMPMKNVFASQYNSIKDKPQSFPVKADGTFSFSLPNGWYVLEFSAVGHQQERTANYVYCAGPELRVEATLEANAFEESIDSVQFVSEEDNYNFAKAQAMRKETNGTWSFDITSSKPRLGYQVIVYTKLTDQPHSINGTQSESYEYDGGGDYRSIVSLKNGKARVVFDPRLLPSSKGTSSVDFKDEFSKSVKSILDEQRSIMTISFEQSAKRQEGKEYSFDTKKIHADIYERIQKENNKELKHVLMMSYLNVPPVDKEENGMDKAVIDEILTNVPPSSVVWGNYQNSILKAIANSSNPKSDYAERVLRENPCSAVKAQILFTQVKDLLDRKREVEAAPLYDQLIHEYTDTYAAQTALKELNPGRRIQIGMTIPEFAFESLDDSTKKLSPSSVKGKWTLIDNWATWCGPCVGEMASLHKAYENFKDKNFTILSVSFDRSKADIVKFRAAKWPMPWQHCFSAGVWQNEAAKVFEVNGIPKPILIDPKGKIVALDGQLRGATLEQTLEKYVK